MSYGVTYEGLRNDMTWSTGILRLTTHTGPAPLCRAQREVAALAWGLGCHLPRLGWRSAEDELARFVRRVVPPLLEEGFAAMQSSARAPLGCEALLGSMRGNNLLLFVNPIPNRDPTPNRGA